MSKEIQVDYLLSILPAHLKSEVSYYLFKDAIDVVKVFQDKDQRFYGEYLNKFESMHIHSQTTFAKEGDLPQEVYFLLTGCILKESSLSKQLGMKNTYLIEGSIFGETDVMKNRPRVESYTAVTESYILKLSKADFGELLEEFDDFN